jgi:uncharacterized protein YndB with AHSA1/START domain
VSAQPAAAAPTVLQLRRTIAAPRAEVFRAWTEPELFSKWFRPPGTRAPEVELDPRPGGRWRVTLTARGIKPPSWRTFGEFVEVDAPSRLVFTMGWESIPVVRRTDSLVTVELEDRGERTELVLTQERLQNLTERVWHGYGWRVCLWKLARMRSRTPS